jgi:hypothetical protein
MNRLKHTQQGRTQISTKGSTLTTPTSTTMKATAARRALYDGGDRLATNKSGARKSEI